MTAVAADNRRERGAVTPIGVIHSCFTEKFGIPRQPGMVKSATARLELFSQYGREEMVRGLRQFSHIWVLFLFHQVIAEGWKPTVRPPRLGGRKRVGVFASRSPHRPNHIGMSAVRLEEIVWRRGRCFLELSGVDFLDNSPVLDIKPYVPYCDSVDSASCGYADDRQPAVTVEFSRQAGEFCTEYLAATGRNIRRLIGEMIRHDPRPASQKQTKSSFGMLLWDVNVRWTLVRGIFRVERCSILTARQTPG